MDDAERAAGVRYCKRFDEIISPVPWFLTVKFINSNNLDFVTHDAAPHTTENYADCYKESK